MSKTNQQTMAGRVIPISNGPLKAETIIRQIYYQQQHGEEECSLEYSDVDQDTAYEVIEELDENNEDRVHRPTILPTPTIVVESGWSETREKLHEDMRVWLIGGRPHVQMVIIVKWTRTSDERVTGDVEVFERDENDQPRSVQKEIIFPEPPSAVADQQVIKITKRQLWGQNLPAGQDPDDRYDMLMKDLRREGRQCIARMRLNPA
ncbi:uncharacterized protein TRUGW13939_06565 [Talaromyces rugulosus]|uniref:Uncharacterized protein n=1 Tax=Talaromyces rugulosus TaxID=121627 RepID=A0A7H8R182_TALRU|nr:uncharacterized protein TRUGW13939_06565 [Talaromyces rugulosus]QKX59431.1 hypothetical protein TRUGW13939_06565 [Talaromyces rugulosus]